MLLCTLYNSSILICRWKKKLPQCLFFLTNVFSSVVFTIVNKRGQDGRLLWCIRLYLPAASPWRRAVQHNGMHAPSTWIINAMRSIFNQTKERRSDGNAWQQCRGRWPFAPLCALKGRHVQHNIDKERDGRASVYVYVCARACVCVQGWWGG